MSAGIVFYGIMGAIGLAVVIFVFSPAGKRWIDRNS